MSSAADEVADYLDQNMIELFDGTNLFVGDPSNEVADGISAFRVTVSNTGGIGSIPFVDGGSRNRIDRLGVMIRIRGDKNDSWTAEIAAERIVNLLSFKSFGSFFECVVTNGSFNRLGVDGDGYPMFSINIIVHRATPGTSLPLLRYWFGPPPVSYDLAWFNSTIGIMESASRYCVFSLSDAAPGNSIFFICPQVYGRPVFRGSDTEDVYNGFETAYITVDGVIWNIWKLNDNAPLPNTDLLRIQ